MKISVIELLQTLLRPALNIEVAEQPVWAKYTEKDIESLLEMCRANRLGAHMLESAKRTETPLPDQVNDYFQDAQRKLVWQNSLYLQTVRLAVTTLKKEGIRFGIFKGGLGQHLIYGSYFIKKTSDVDIFVSVPDYNRAANALAKIGFEPHEACESLWWTFFLGEQHLASKRAGLMPIDLHSRCYQPGCPRPKDPDYFLKSLVTQNVGSESVPSLSLESNCLYTAMSFCKAFIHREPSGKYLPDLVMSFAVMSIGEKKSLVETARQQQMLQCLAFASDCCALVLGTGLDLLELPKSKAMVSMAPDHMIKAILAPDDKDIAWPQRTRSLIDFTDDLFTLPGAIVWKLSSDIWFNLIERRRVRSVDKRSLSQQTSS